MAKPRKPKETVIEPSEMNVITAPAGTVIQPLDLSKVEPKKVNAVPLIGVGRDAAGNIGVYVLTFDIANGNVMDQQFIKEGGPTEAVERFKILAGNIFMTLG